MRKERDMKYPYHVSRVLAAAGMLAALILFCMSPSYSQTAPVIGLHENTPSVVALTHARIVIAPGQVIGDATLVMRDEQIVAVGENAEVPPDAVVRDMTGLTLYPGFIDLWSHYGMSDEQTAGTNASALHWNETVRPDRTAADMFEHSSEEAKAMRKNGFTAVVTYPSKGVFRGSGSLVLLDDGIHDGTIIVEHAGQAVDFLSRGGEYPRSLMGGIALVRQTLLDAEWYARARAAYTASPTGQKAPEMNVAFDALSRDLHDEKPLVFATSECLDILRASSIAREFGLGFRALGCGSEYRRIDAVKATGVRLILPLNFPESPDVSTDETSLRNLLHWNAAPENPARLSDAGIAFSLTAAKLEKNDDFLKNLRTAVKRGLSHDDALAALTITPASWLESGNRLGSLDAGKLANIIVTDGCLFEDDTSIVETWVAGTRFEISPRPDADVRGTWTVDFIPRPLPEEVRLEISGTATKPKTKLLHRDKKVDTLKTTLDKRMFMLAFPADSLGMDGVVRMTGMIEEGAMHGGGTWGDGSSFTWSARLVKAFEAPPDTANSEAVLWAVFPVTYPDGIYGREAIPEQPDAIIVKNATIWTCASGGILEGADMLVKNGRIDRIGKSLKAPSGAVVIDAAGRHVTPGLIDAHSHLAVSGGVNEPSHSITSEARIIDVIDCDDINIYRQMAGGLTTSCLLHGSANSIGGQNAVVKLRWGLLPEDMLIDDAKPTIKFALGENVKRSNVPGPPTTRYPRSRMGVEQFMRDSFSAAKDYRQAWLDYEKGVKENPNLVPPRRDLRLEPLVEILNGKRWIHCHSYRQDEIEAMIRVADDMGFTVNVFIHNLEGYKVADMMREHGSMPTVFSDWWAYKYEVIDSIPYNGAMLHSRGLVVSFNSDNVELARRMNLEAAKAVKYGGVSPEEALKFVTINSAIQLGINHRTGSLEEGKDADFVIWSGDPLSVYSKCEQTWIDGRRYFDVDESRRLEETAARERNTLVQKILSGASDGKKK